MMKIASVAAFAATIPAANWLIGNVGTVCIPQGPCLIPVGFGLMAPSGVIMIGAALVLRDLVHEVAGKTWALTAIAIGCILSLLVSPPALAVASAAAFGFSELANHGVYSRLRQKGRALAVAGSGVVGAFLDSALFVYLAFGSFDFSAGTTLAKIYASAAVAVWLYARAKCVLGHRYGPWYGVTYGGGPYGDWAAQERDCSRCGKIDTSRSSWIWDRP